MTSIEMRDNPLFMRNGFDTVGKWDIPLVKKQNLGLTDIQLVACSDTRANDNEVNKKRGVHFFVDDFRFEGIYNNPERTLDKYSQYAFLLTPDFSLYADMPLWKQLENVAKNRWVGAYWQNKGLKVIPTIAWSTARSFDFCFDGVEHNGIVAVGMIGCKKTNLVLSGATILCSKNCNRKLSSYWVLPFPKCKVTLLPSTIRNRERWCGDMGGRGTFASGINVAYTYETVGKIGGIKILKGMSGKHGLPEEAHSSNSYVSLHPNGSVKQIRIYHSNHTAKTDIEFSMHRGKMTLHAHDYVNGVRQPPRELTEEERKQYNKFFGGVK